MPNDLQPSPGRDVYLALVQAHEVLVGEFAELFRRHGTTQAQFNVLRVLVQASKGTASCAEIGERLIHRVPDVTRLIDRMEAGGWVARRRSDQDRRVVLVSITEAGQALCEGLYGDVEALHARQTAHLPPADLTRLAADLTRLHTGRPSPSAASGRA
ncbi:MAG: MarR family transcriptional regulator [Planctomycetota bacterium]